MRVDPPAPATVVHEDQGADGARRSEVAISYLLRVGVIVSLLVVVTGTIVTFVHHPEYVRSSAAYPRLTAPRSSPFRRPGDVIDGLRHMKGQAVVTLGLLLLVATPVLRVTASIGLFALQRDRTFVAITSLVLVLLVTSFLLGKAGG